MTTDDRGDLVEAFPVDAGHLARLHRTLTAAAEAEGILDVSYDVVDTPVGPLLLAATDLGLVRVAYEGEDHDSVLRALAEKISPRVLRAPGRLAEVRGQLDEYFAGRRRTFDVPLDWRLSRGFRQLVLRALPSVEYGHTAPYSTIARLVGNPGAVRAVGTACATNPIPVVVPCHRVIRADGSAGRYLGGPEAKKVLLALEAAA
ncbi:methylated-DNA--[protein]-cysteine S-methyltransferase [Actinoplanes sp. RD1]|uniref:methylated-DNA--[protein]-cysteine S-methyltransferase n=1 Tax=Actinoplanes sp. RD1 TaxID=3064538 RepID=UPI0027406CD3|nr:methylated-DNA--[protein]-cysteine S-methyltransferase [Actinoplanes sp. RD1]